MSLRLYVTSGKANGLTIPLEPGELMIGRVAGDPGRLGGDPELSREHARVVLHADGTVTVEDLGSTNGTYVNDDLLTEICEMRPGDRLELGTTTLELADSSNPDPTRLGAGRLPVVARVDPVVQAAEPQPRPRVPVTIMAAAVAVVAVVVLGVALLGGGDSNEGEPTTAALSSQERIGAAERGTLRLRGRDQFRRDVGATATLVDAGAGLALTNAHVVAGVRSLQAIISSGGQRVRVPVSVEAQAPCDDLALVRLHDPPRGLKALTFAKGGVTRGDGVVALGYPVGLQGPRPFNQSVTMVSTDGTVSVPDTPAEPGVDAPRYRSLVQHTATLNPGSSGGPLLNDRGEVVGINALTTAGSTEGQFYAITVSRILPVLKRLREGDANEYVGWGLIPNSAREDYGLTDSFLRDVGIVPQRSGLFNLGSDPASPGARRFTNIGETVTSIQQRPVDTIEQTCAILRSQRDQAELSVDGVGRRGTAFGTRTVKLPGR